MRAGPVENNPLGPADHRLGPADHPRVREERVGSAEPTQGFGGPRDTFRTTLERVYFDCFTVNTCPAIVMRPFLVP